MFNSFFIAFFLRHMWLSDHEMIFIDFCSELLSHEILLQNQQQQPLTPKANSFVLQVNQAHHSNLHFPYSK